VVGGERYGERRGMGGGREMERDSGEEIERRREGEMGR
jgi:hypothetical protein